MDRTQVRTPRRRAVALVATVIGLAAIGPIGGASARPIAEADASRSIAEGPGLLGGQQHVESTFTIHAVSVDGTFLTTGGHRFMVTIAQPEPTATKVKDNHDGTYSVAYTPALPGTYVVEVTLGGSPIRDAPFTVPVKPAPSASRSFAEGPGLGVSVAGEETSFTIHAIDEAGNPRADGGDSFSVDIHGPGGRVPTQTTDNEDGTYTVRFTLPAAGAYVVKVTYQGRHILGSPYLIRAG